MEKIKLCVVGLNFGSWIIENELSLNKHEYIEIAAVCDFNREKADTWAGRLGVTAYYNLDDVLADPNIHAVGLFTGPVGRAELIDKIISAGRHVMTTKPFELSSAKALEVLKKAKRLGRVVHLNSPSTSPCEDLKKIRNWIDTYKLGRSIGFRASVWCSYREKADGSWYDDPYLCPAAPIFRIGIYLINDIIPLFGEVEQLNVLHSRIFTKRPTPDNAQLNILFKNGAIGNIFASFCIDDGQYYRNTLELNFEHGTIYRNMGPTARTESTPITLELAANTAEGQIILKEEISERGSGYQWDVFYRMAKGEDVPGTVEPEMIANAIHVIELMKEQTKI